MNRKDYEAEIARLESDPDDLLHGKVVAGTVARERRSLFSLRIGADELTELVAAADAAGKTTSEFIREAALAAARRSSMDLPAPVLDAVDELVKRYTEAKAGTKRRRRVPAK